MKLQIDTKAKTIKIDETVKITELVKILKKLLPKEWEDYSLQNETPFVYWYNPIPWHYERPWRIGEVTYTSGGETVPATTICYNIDVVN
jgi:hypothetical protein